MQRMPGVDAGYFYMETPALHMHTLKIAVLEPPADGYHFDMLRDELDRRLHLLPPFCRRVLRVPGGLYHPMWFEDADIDVSDHVHRVVLPAPGNWEQVEGVIGDVASRPLDRARPLWEVHAIEGLEGGRIVIVTKVHHALADGVASATLLANVMDTTPIVGKATRESWHSDRLPSRAEMQRAALRDLITDLRRLPGLLIRTVRAIGAVIRHRRTASVHPPRPILDAPRTSFNRAITPRRSFATATLSLDSIRSVRRAFDAPFTDVVLAVIGGALREWLISRGELPSKSLMAGVPVANDDALGSTRLIGNKVSNIFTSLATDLSDPVARLRRIGDVTAAARKVQELLGLDMLEQWVQFTPPALMSGFMQMYSRFNLADRHPPPFNVVVSNVPGPREELSVAGARLTDLYSVGPILEGIGLNVTVWSYLDRLNFSALACPDVLPDLRGIVERLQPALDELVKAAEESASSVA
ncbi:MAG: WS/DGAT/MGAT family O-acyltransferase [Actinomycetes bacterium]